MFGRKTGEGWYQYRDGKKLSAASAGMPSHTLSDNCSVWIEPAAERHAELAALSKQAGARITQSPDEASLLLIQPWGIDVSQACAELDLDARRCVAIDPLPSLEMRRTLMLSPITRAQSRDDAAAILGADNAPYTIINDSPGLWSSVCWRPS